MTITIDLREGDDTIIAVVREGNGEPREVYAQDQVFTRVQEVVNNALRRAIQPLERQLQEKRRRRVS